MAINKNPRVGFVILSWNGADLLRSCLEGLVEQTHKDFVVCIVDNGSTDNTSTVCEEFSSRVVIHVVKNKLNEGYAKANNQGIQAIIKSYPSLEYIALLNNDASPHEDWLKIMLAYMDSHPDIGLSQGANYTDKDMKTFDSTGIYLEEGFIPRQRAFGKSTPELDTVSIGPNAACVILRRTFIDDISYKGELLDSRFFAYVEDVDLLLRAQLRGWKHGFVPDAKTVHIGSVTGERVSAKKMYWGTRNLVWMVAKNVPLKIFIKQFKKILISHLANMEYLYKTNRRLFFSYLRGFSTGLLLTPTLFNKRRWAMKNRRISDKEFSALLTPSTPPITNPFRALVRKIHG